jgi:hypothetical protein
VKKKKKKLPSVALSACRRYGSSNATFAKSTNVFKEPLHSRSASKQKTRALSLSPSKLHSATIARTDRLW